MKNLKILIIAAVIGLATVGCGEDGGTTPGEPTPGTTVLSGKVGLSEEAQELVDAAEELLNTYNDEDLDSAASDLADAADAVDAATTEEELEVAANAVIAALEALSTAASEVATAEEVASLNSSANEFIATAVEVDTIVVVVGEEEITTDGIVTTTVNLIINSNETCPADTETEHFVCSKRGDVYVSITSAQTCPADTDNLHFNCTLKSDVNLILNSGQTCPADSSTEHYICSFRIDAHAYVNLVHGDSSTYECPEDTDTIHYTDCSFRYAQELKIEFGADCPAPTETQYFICTEQYDLEQFDGMTADKGSTFELDNVWAQINLDNGRYTIRPEWQLDDGTFIWSVYDFQTQEYLEYNIDARMDDENSIIFTTDFGKDIVIHKNQN